MSSFHRNLKPQFANYKPEFDFSVGGESSEQVVSWLSK